MKSQYDAKTDSGKTVIFSSGMYKPTKSLRFMVKDTSSYVLIEPAHNPKGLGSKTRGATGRFVKKIDWGLGIKTGLCFFLLMGLMYFAYIGILATWFQPTYPTVQEVQ